MRTDYCLDLKFILNHFKLHFMFLSNWRVSVWAHFSCAHDISTTCDFRFTLLQVALPWNACVKWEGAITDMIIMIFNVGRQRENQSPRSIKPEPWKSLLPLALDMFTFQPHNVKQPPHSQCARARMCPKCGWRIASLPEWMVSHPHFSAGWFNRGTA